MAKKQSKVARSSKGQRNAKAEKRSKGAAKSGAEAGAKSSRKVKTKAKSKVEDEALEKDRAGAERQGGQGGKQAGKQAGKKRGKKVAKKAAGRKSAGPRGAKAGGAGSGQAGVGGPLTVEEARAAVALTALPEAKRGAPRAKGQSKGKSKGTGAPRGVRAVPEEDLALGAARAEAERRARIQREQERRKRTKEYEQVYALLEKRGVRASGPRAKSHAPRSGLMRLMAEGDSWFDYPLPFFGGGIITRLERKLGVPILNMACKGDEVRYMLGVEQRRVLTKKLSDAQGRGQPWDVLLFSGGGNDIVDNPMALWVREHDPALTPRELIHWPRFEAQLAIVRAGYEDLIALRDELSPTTLLVFHGYDFAIPDGRGVCHFGPWLSPTFKLRHFPTEARGGEVVKLMLQRFAAILAELAAAHPRVELLPTQGTLAPVKSSWHNELHPSKTGFTTFADLFASKLGELFPGRLA